MAQTSVTINDVGFRNALRQYQAALGKSWRDVLRGQGRLVAVSLATSTQPYGAGAKPGMVGKARVEKDIRKVFQDPKDFIRLAARIAARKSKKPEAAEFDRLIRYESDRSAIAKLTTNMQLGEETLPSPDRAKHQARRNARGRVGKGKPYFISDPRSLDRYIKARQKLVGFAKSAWAGCARTLGGTRGISQYVTRNRAPFQIVDNTASTTNPAITMRSLVTYASAVLPAREVAKALNIQRQKMLKSIDRTLRTAAKKSGF